VEAPFEIHSGEDQAEGDMNVEDVVATWVNELPAEENVNHLERVRVVEEDGVRQYFIGARMVSLNDELEAKYENNWFPGTVRGFTPQRLKVYFPDEDAERNVCVDVRFKV
jgi:hypothetical protein